MGQTKFSQRFRARPCRTEKLTVRSLVFFFFSLRARRMVPPPFSFYSFFLFSLAARGAGVGLFYVTTGPRVSVGAYRGALPIFLFFFFSPRGDRHSDGFFFFISWVVREFFLALGHESWIHTPFFLCWWALQVVRCGHAYSLPFWYAPGGQSSRARSPFFPCALRQSSWFSLLFFFFEDCATAQPPALRERKFSSPAHLFFFFPPRRDLATFFFSPPQGASGFSRTFCINPAVRSTYNSPSRRRGCWTPSLFFLPGEVGASVTGAVSTPFPFYYDLNPPCFFFFLPRGAPPPLGAFFAGALFFFLLLMRRVPPFSCVVNPYLLAGSAPFCVRT